MEEIDKGDFEVDIQVYDQDDNSHELAKEVGKTFLLSAVAAIGTLGGMLVIGGIAGWVSERRARRADRKAEQEPEVEE